MSWTIGRGCDARGRRSALRVVTPGQGDECNESAPPGFGIHAKRIQSGPAQTRKTRLLDGVISAGGAPAFDIKQVRCGFVRVESLAR